MVIPENCSTDPFVGMRTMQSLAEAVVNTTPGPTAMKLSAMDRLAGICLSESVYVPGATHTVTLTEAPRPSENRLSTDRNTGKTEARSALALRYTTED